MACMLISAGVNRVRIRGLKTLARVILLSCFIFIHVVKIMSRNKFF